MPGYSRALEPFSKFNCFMDTLTHNRNHQSLNEVVDLGAVGRTDGLELRVQHVVQLEPHVLSVEGHLGPLGGLVLEGGGAIDVIESDDVPKGLGVDDQALSRIGRNRLAPLVMAYVALCAPHAYCKSSLGDSEFFADGFNSAHGRIVAPLLFIVNSGAILIFLAAALM